MSFEIERRNSSTSSPKISNHVTISDPAESENKDHEPLMYGIDDKPPWYMCILLGFQHYLEMVGVTVACPFILTPTLCMLDDDPDKANIVNTLVFMMGVITILQVTFGTRLPIIQGASFSYLLPSLAIMNLPKWKCPSVEEIQLLPEDDRRELWQVRSREIHGAIICAAGFEAIFGLVGLIGFLTKYVTPLTVAPALTLIGLALFKVVTVQVAKNAWVGLSMVVLLILFSQHLRNVTLRLPFVKSKSKGFPLFRLFPVLMALGIVWGICAILTYMDVLPEGDPARVDAKARIIRESTWFRIPYPFQWGIPTISLAAVLGMLCGVLASTVESIGDYVACATISKVSTPPEHSMNRGIFMEGIGCVLGGILGSGNGSTSACINIGTIGITRVASRRVFITSGFIIIALGLVGKAGAVFMAIPDPILGGLFAYLFPLCIAVGVGTLKDVDMNSPRNLYIFAFAVFAGIAISQWAENNPGAIQTGSEGADALLQILLNVGMFVAGLIGFVLDNTVPGTDEERGIKKTPVGRTTETVITKDDEGTYDLPFGMKLIKRFSILEYLPISPTYKQNTRNKT